ncbi:alkyl sulfatase C-terminal domain-containing protein, partial [Thermodesulfobacteriota bacterium]
IKAMGVDLLFDFLAIRLNGPKASGRTIIINTEFTDINENYVLTLENGVLKHIKKRRAENADIGLILTRAVLDEIVLGEATPDQKVASGELKVEGSLKKLDEFFSLLDSFEFWFNIVTP